MKRPCLEHHCPQPAVARGRCLLHKLTTSQRGYGPEHQAARRALALTLPAPCAYGCGVTLRPGDDWVAAHVVDDDHDDGSRRAVRRREQRSLANSVRSQTSSASRASTEHRSSTASCDRPRDDGIVTERRGRASGGGTGRRETALSVLHHAVPLPREILQRKACRHCAQVKPLDAFPPSRRTADGSSSWCRACHVERTRRWRADHRAEYNAATRRRYRERKETPMLTDIEPPELVEQPGGALDVGEQEGDRARGEVMPRHGGHDAHAVTRRQPSGP